MQRHRFVADQPTRGLEGRCESLEQLALLEPHRVGVRRSCAELRLYGESAVRFRAGPRREILSLGLGPFEVGLRLLQGHFGSLQSSPRFDELVPCLRQVRAQLLFPRPQHCQLVLQHRCLAAGQVRAFGHQGERIGQRCDLASRRLPAPLGFALKVQDLLLRFVDERLRAHRGFALGVELRLRLGRRGLSGFELDQQVVTLAFHRDLRVLQRGDLSLERLDPLRRLLRPRNLAFGLTFERRERVLEPGARLLQRALFVLQQFDDGRGLVALQRQMITGNNHGSVGGLLVDQALVEPLDRRLCVARSLLSRTQLIAQVIAFVAQTLVIFEQRVTLDGQVVLHLDQDGALGL